MDIISSASNTAIKYLRKLATNSRFRREENTVVAHGIHLVRSCLDAGVTPKMYVVAELAHSNTEIAALITELEDTSVQHITTKDTLYESLSDVHASVGISVVFTPPSVTDKSGILSRDALLLEGIQDPGNLGTALRTAAAADIKDIYLSTDATSAWSPKALRAGMGAQFWLTIHENVDLLHLATGSAVPVLATTLSAKSSSLYEEELRNPVAWAFGNEGGGLSNDLESASTRQIHIPQADTPVESLNVAAAVAVCLFEQNRQRLS
ncbi:MAG: tRNA/rRNA methyltransferase [Candidatus Saccharibacteria bacterium GW2011_GWC2_48_9]|nr:MAG: tRNA/rRNA methyltransferase [Candidatus Saccharibacteria bacterium GW2011_GWC2_48_9]